MKIGIGVTTYNRPRHAELCEKQITGLTFSQSYSTNGGGVIGADFNHNTVYMLVVDDSKERKGIAYRKNECLKRLAHCDYIFLFDDDCFPIKDGWAEFFIGAHKASGQHHFLYLKETSTIRLIQAHQNRDLGADYKFSIRTIMEYNNCGGCFMFLTKEVIEKVGGYCKDYGYYGFEHAGYSQRIHAAGLTPMGAYLCPAGAGEYIYAMDYDFHLPFNKQVNHQPSMMNEINKIPEYIEQNRKVFLKDVETIYQPL